MDPLRYGHQETEKTHKFPRFRSGPFDKQYCEFTVIDIPEREHIREYTIRSDELLKAVTIRRTANSLLWQ